MRITMFSRFFSMRFWSESGKNIQEYVSALYMAFGTQGWRALFGLGQKSSIKGNTSVSI